MTMLHTPIKTRLAPNKIAAESSKQGRVGPSVEWVAYFASLSCTVGVFNRSYQNILMDGKGSYRKIFLVQHICHSYSLSCL